MALSERLAFLIDVDGSGAIKGFQKVGSTAEKELGKVDDRLDKIGTRLTMGGAGALAFAGVAGGALMSFATSSEEANRSQLLLNNTLANAPKLAGETAGQFNDLAEAIQGKTAADGDQIVSAMAMLGTFSLTADEIKGATPLVVDYARKFGVDLTNAAVQVGKALDGSIGALKKNGVSIDEALYKTDRFAAVTQALRDQVGGFAEEEGATFSGRMARLKNELGDVQEGLGVGVVGAATAALRPLTAVSDAFGDMSPKAQETAGNLLAIGTAGIGAIGGMSLVAGQLIKLRDRFTEVDAANVRSLTTMGKLATGLGVAAAVAGMTVALKGLHDASGEVQADLEEISGATADQMVQTWNELGTVVAHFEGEQKAANEQLDFFTQVAQGNITAARDLRDALAAAGIDVSALDAVLTAEAETQQRATERAQTGAAVVDELAGETEGLAEAVKAADQAISDYGDTLDETLGVSLDVRAAHRETREAVDDLTEALMKGREKGENAAQFNDRLSESLDNVVRSLADEVDAMADAGEITDTVTDRNGALIWKLAELKGKYPALAGEIDIFIAAAEAAADKTGPAGERAARDFIDGIVNGLRNGQGQVAQSADAVARIIESRTRAGLEEESPSKVGVRIGEDFTKGIAIGVDKGSPEVLRYIDALVDNAVDRASEMARASGTRADLAESTATLSELEREKESLPQRIRNATQRLNDERRDLRELSRPGRGSAEQIRAQEQMVERLQETLNDLFAASGSIDQRIAAARRDVNDARLDVISAGPAPGPLTQAEADALRWRGAQAGFGADVLRELIAAINALASRPNEVIVDGQRLGKAVTPHVQTELIKIGKRNGGGVLAGLG